MPSHIERHELRARIATLEIAFDSKAIRALCENEAKSRQALGAAVSEFLKHRLADLKAARSPKDLIAGRPRNGANPHEMIIELCDGYYLAFKASHVTNPVTQNNELDWSKVSRIKIMRIEKHHA